MTQLELICRVPERGTQCYEILMYLQSGRSLTVAKALSELGVYALSQRCGELKREYGWPIRSETKKVGPRTFVAEYSLVAKSSSVEADHRQREAETVEG